VSGEEGPLPDLREAILDADKLAALLRDIAALTKVDDIIVKGRPGQEPASVPLDEVQQLLLGGEIRGVQIRYRHDGAVWWDTLMCTAEGVKLVRIRHLPD
jgi:hypothetical protein